MRPPPDAQRPPAGGPTDERIAERQALGHHTAGVRHGERTCLGRDGLRARHDIAESWLIWGAPYRRNARDAMWARETAA
jgi:hypothetical protein